VDQAVFGNKWECQYIDGEIYIKMISDGDKSDKLNNGGITRVHCINCTYYYNLYEGNFNCQSGSVIFIILLHFQIVREVFILLAEKNCKI
jgi:hypothetical protein